MEGLLLTEKEFLRRGPMVNSLTPQWGEEYLDIFILIKMEKKKIFTLEVC